MNTYIITFYKNKQPIVSLKRQGNDMESCLEEMKKEITMRNCSIGITKNLNQEGKQ